MPHPIKTINDLIKILAYNDWAWEDLAPHPKDRTTVTSLAEAQYAWTEKQAKLAISLLKRYLTKFEKHGLKVRPLLNNPIYDAPFRVISAKKIIEEVANKDNEISIQLTFPYDKKLVDLIKCIKEKRGLPRGYLTFDGESKTWTGVKSDVMVYYTTLIAIRYNFEFANEKLLDEYEEIKKEKLTYKKPCAMIENNKINLNHVPESLLQYWQKNIQSKKLLCQLDNLKQVGVPQKNLRVKAYSEVGKRIAHNHNRHLWIDKDAYSKDDVILGFKELDMFPIIMPVSGDITDNIADTKDFCEWLKCFERHGIDPLKNLSWGFELKEPKRRQDKKTEEEQRWLMPESPKWDEETFQQAYDLYQCSKSFKHLDTNTKVYFIRNRLPRSFMRYNQRKEVLKFQTALIAIGGGFYATGGENIKRLLDNLPKKLYYSTSRPMSYEWASRAINKL